MLSKPFIGQSFEVYPEMAPTERKKMDTSVKVGSPVSPPSYPDEDCGGW